MEFSQPPPDITPMSSMTFNVPPPTMMPPPPPPQQSHRPSGSHHHHHHYHNQSGGAGKPGQPFFRPFVNFGRGPGGLPMTQDDFDGKRLRKSVMRKTVDYNAAIIRSLEVCI